MSTQTEQKVKPDSLAESYDRAEDKLIYLQRLVSDRDIATMSDFLAVQSDYEIASLLESFPHDARQLIWESVPVELKGQVLAEVVDDSR
ncbi:MAG TPA: magnesium transporter, partial [Psychrobacter sp.]|nr:magnesium transporter [Psychrobacter sp.]